MHVDPHLHFVFLSLLPSLYASLSHANTHTAFWIHQYVHIFVILTHKCQFKATECANAVMNNYTEQT